ncbi:MAG: hypothetical protein K1X36_07395 [Pyrinomonadaceae bacterium]|nr:hypothetical protein [Pyrinomonadaceae bacterium]
MSCQISILRSIFIAAIIIVTANASYAAAVVDRSFGVNGAARIQIGQQNILTDILFVPGGKIAAVMFSDHGFVRIARFQPNGQPDATFGTQGLVTIPTPTQRIYDAAVLNDGRILLAGSYFPGGNAVDFLVTRLNPDGTVDQTFGNGGIFSVNQGSFDVINKLAIQPDGKIVCAGYTSDAGGYQVVLRLNANGTFDTSFSGGMAVFRFPPYPHATPRWLQTVKILDDGSILTAAPINFAHPTGIALGIGIARLTAAGVLDQSFGTQGTSLASRPAPNGYNEIVDVETLPGGRFVAAYTSGVTVFESNGSFVRDLPFEATWIERTPSGNLLGAGDNPLPAARAGGIKVYTEQSIIGKSSLPGRPFAAPDGRIIVGRIDDYTNELIVTALTRLTSQGTRMADFDRDDRTDLAFQRGQYFYAQKSGGGTIFNLQTFFGATVIPEMSEHRLPSLLLDRNTIVFAARGIPNVSRGLYRRISDTTGEVYFNSIWGLPGDIPTGGDFDGNGQVDMTVFRPSDGVWYSIFGENDQFRFVRWGAEGDKPVPADYDYDGKTDQAVYRPSTGTWWISRSSDGGTTAVRFGVASDIPITGDYDADGRADLTVYRPSEGNWYQYLTTDGIRVTRFGLAGDIPVPGDYDGDGRHDIALFRSGVWYLLKSSEGFAAVTVPGVLPDDVPVSTRYDQ